VLKKGMELSSVNGRNVTKMKFPRIVKLIRQELFSSILHVSEVFNISNKTACRVVWRNHQTDNNIESANKKAHEERMERIENGNPNLVSWFSHTYNELPTKLLNKVGVTTGEPVVLENVDDIKKGDKIQSINGKHVQDLWVFQPLDIRREDFMIRTPEGLVLCVNMANMIKKDFETFLKKQKTPITITFSREC